MDDVGLKVCTVYLQIISRKCGNVFIMPRCTMHRRHAYTVVRWCAGPLVCQILHIFMSGELQVLKVGQYAKMIF